VQDSDGSNLGYQSPEVDDPSIASQKLSLNSCETSLPQHDVLQIGRSVPNQSKNSSVMQVTESAELLGDASEEPSLVPTSTCPSPVSLIRKSTAISNGPARSARCRTMLGRNSVSICFLDL
jgi:hypothetical protein